ncbi:aminoglycoside phosphotransferase family protein [Deinococcus apachensis]|uniref:aminoglycoside phosphotransferase family protein n=1 Tax=Deinococcus apachensis TaxID=309886 RepID=UPI00037D2A5F|nr:aminoglycoside phosphotransferase family protein [Deinococcus apachensis]
MSPPLRTTLHAVIAHPDGQRVAAVSGMLPSAVVTENTFVGSGISGAFPALAPWLAPLRRLGFARLPTEPDGTLVRESIWQLDPVTDVSGVEWATPDALPEHQQFWAESALTPIPDLRPEFARPGWAAGALAWLDGELREQGLTRRGWPDPLKHWGISALWRVPLVEGGPLYLKAVPAFFAREVPVTCLLSREIPGAAPPVLAADTGRNLLLLAHAGDVPDEAENGVTLAAHLAWVQRASLPLLPEFRALGLPDHGPEWVTSLLPELLRDEHFMVGEAEGLTPDEAAKLRALEPRVREACARLAASPLPRVAGHGDLHRWNTVRDGEGQWTLLDWSDASVTHPFLDADPAYLAPEDAGADTLEAVENAYLSAWTDLLPLPELRALLREARLVGEVYRALGYTHAINLHLEDRAGWRAAHLEHLRGLLLRAAEPALPLS